jgi:hypothetical protein
MSALIERVQKLAGLDGEIEERVRVVAERERDMDARQRAFEDTAERKRVMDTLLLTMEDKLKAGDDQLHHIEEEKKKLTSAKMAAEARMAAVVAAEAQLELMKDVKKLKTALVDEQKKLAEEKKVSQSQPLLPIDVDHIIELIC